MEGVNLNVTNSEGKPRGSVGELLPEGEVIPCGDRILVKLDDVEEKSAGGIIMATASEREREQVGQDCGVVISLGPLIFLDYEGLGDTPEDRTASYGVKVGDRVTFDRYEGKAPRVVGYERHRLIRSMAIQGVVKTDDRVPVETEKLEPHHGA